jgi:hypothetical protein
MCVYLYVVENRVVGQDVCVFICTWTTEEGGGLLTIFLLYLRFVCFTYCVLYFLCDVSAEPYSC